MAFVLFADPTAANKAIEALDRIKGDKRCPKHPLVRYGGFLKVSLLGYLKVVLLDRDHHAPFMIF